MSRASVRLLPTDGPGYGSVSAPDAAAYAAQQANYAALALDRPDAAFLQLPWPSLDALVGDLPPGQLWYLCGFSGDGKTTFLTSLVLDLIAAGRRVYYLGLESTPLVIRTHFACKTLGYHTGDILSGKYRTWPNRLEVRDAIKAEIGRLAFRGAFDDGHKLLVSEVRELDPMTVQTEAWQAKEQGADLFVVDHVDHLAGDGTDQWALSVAVNKTLLHVTQQHELRTLAASQLNGEAVRVNRALRYLPPSDSMVWMGQQKRHKADGMLGVYRPMKLAGIDKVTLKKFNARMIEPREVLEPNTMAVSVMKHRLYGEREGNVAFLRVQQGRVQEFHPRDHAAIDHGISTTRRSLV